VLPPGVVFPLPTALRPLQRGDLDICLVSVPALSDPHLLALLTSTFVPLALHCARLVLRITCSPFFCGRLIPVVVMWTHGGTVRLSFARSYKFGQFRPIPGNIWIENIVPGLFKNYFYYQRRETVMSDLKLTLYRGYPTIFR